MYTDQFAPYNFINEHGQLVGANYDIVNALCIKAEVECDFKVMPWKRAAMLVHKKPYSAIFSMAQHTNRIPLFNWLGPLTTARTYFYKLKSRPDVTVNTLNDTTLYSLGMVRGDIYQSLVKKIGFVNGQNLMTFGEEQQYIQLFINNKIDLILGSEHVIYNQLKPYNVSLLDVEQLTELPVSNDLKDNYLAFNKAVPQHIVDRFQRAFKVLKQERSLDSFIAPYSNN
ncbi:MULTISPECIES: ABC transporter substrate-binding protein [unclassified Pseudoalteromonas]|uniref:substrate-binding periplasmic protein n=1 Tax=unclassified Pseudoalteromonas TaxID=194690 RepID=UPI000BA4E28E|nr:MULTISPECIES: transporter substrate-binding domain-containing protein [unclassified Pseudoalteromonas]AZN34918.1 transporter substrate-binding domain-containing protein [Pseudoalteromonas sp. Xi13]MCQ8820318.1 transporter substrate-binding domain-containing protein [Pseudoalteromonas agarivorans]MDC9522531.1 transporter substrate-binding domain-containing protein [Pseudoalteromonas sp. Angola-31]MDY6889134.1 transporter substrate-binding domain-containing protein [Pseudomonadota bacterium]M